MPYESINPFNGKTLKSFEHLSGSQLEAALASAQATFQTWKHVSYQERAAIVNKAAELMHAQFEDFAKLATLAPTS
jgi:succinate-semialdehyde dehydrogenase/glutarate-semialdehyde dehydrogenase